MFQQKLVYACLQFVFSSVVAMAGLALPGATAFATTLTLEQNFTNSSGLNLVGIGVKIDSGSASMGAITAGENELPTGWTQKELFWAGFRVGDNTFGSSSSVAFPSQYGFVRGGGGQTFSDAAADTGPIGFSADFLVNDPSVYTPEDGDKITILTAFFLGSSDTASLDGNNTSAMYQFTYNGTDEAWGPATFIEREGAFPHQEGYLFWWQNVSGSFEQLSVAVVPEPGTYAMALAGLTCGGFSMWRRRKRS